MIHDNYDRSRAETWLAIAAMAMAVFGTKYFQIGGIVFGFFYGMLGFSMASQVTHLVRCALVETIEEACER